MGIVVAVLTKPPDAVKLLALAIALASCFILKPVAVTANALGGVDVMPRSLFAVALTVLALVIAASAVLIVPLEPNSLNVFKNDFAPGFLITLSLATMANALDWLVPMFRNLLALVVDVNAEAKATVAVLALTATTFDVNWLGNNAPVNVQRSAGKPSHVVKPAHVYG